MSSTALDFEILATRLGKNVIPVTAERVWEAYIMSKPYATRAAGRSAEQNLLTAFAKETGLPSMVTRRYLQACQQFERDFVRRTIKPPANTAYRVSEGFLSEEAIESKYKENLQAPLGERLPSDFMDLSERK